MNLGVWSYNDGKKQGPVKPPPIITSNKAKVGAMDSENVDPKKQNSKTTKSDNNSKSNPINAKTVDAKMKEAEIKNVTDAAKGSQSQYQLVNEVNKSSSMSPSKTGKSIDSHRSDQSSEQASSAVSSQDSAQPGSPGSGRPGSSRRLFTHVTPNQLTRQDSVKKHSPRAASCDEQKAPGNPKNPRQSAPPNLSKDV